MAKFLNTYKYILIALFAGLLCLVYYWIDPVKHVIMPKCPIKLLTTLDCPGCGFQRALHATLHGNLIEAVHYNLFLLVAIPITCSWFLNDYIIENTSALQSKMKLLRINRLLIYIYIFCYFGWFIIRNIYQF